LADHSSIEWTDATANFWRGCDKVSPGCAHCYMFREQRRYGRDPDVVTRCSDPIFFAPLRSRKWNEQCQAIEREQGRRMRVFTCSWSDFFHPAADAWRDEAWDVIRRCPHYDWQILTKRPEMVADRLPADWGEGWPHVWLGVSIENRRFVDRADLLRATPASVRFISAEPLLGPLLPDSEWASDAEHERYPYWDAPVYARREWADEYQGPGLNLDLIDWLIVGGESGSGHRPIRPEWVTALRDYTQDECWQSADGQTAFFFKQWGGPQPTSGGRELDHRTWDEFPPAGLPVGGRG
jgi:protein gp37